MPTPVSPQSISLLARVQRWLGLDDDGASECPCAVAARIERAGAEARAKQLAAKEAAKMRKASSAPAAALSGMRAGDGSDASAGIDRVVGSPAASALETTTVCTFRAAGAAPGTRSRSSREVRPADAQLDRAVTYAMSGFFHSGFLADTFVYLPEVWLGGDGEH
ncbi:hypothetical protein [Pararobbsia silviterrae]|uniref:Uncharacterized protein n=1 Tax=Pararobbsia silviterrae TaxID=1792498 RepID=A0A494X6C4_9BURK|nr:hypothetical protein [Pararobbsia silviterrae]RKP46208.1 hypothetical protein D7S86_25145 [Pararobbsia silviterrae]